MELSDKINRIIELVDRLNEYRDAYYNGNKSLISDHEYDNLFDELSHLEQETNFIMDNSPTRTVGFNPDTTSRQKVTHNHPMLSLDKTKQTEDVSKFLGNHDSVCMAKMDGLTCSLYYVDGVLKRAETRGDGTVGEDITDNIKYVQGVPRWVSQTGEIIIDGEIIITRPNFEAVNASIEDPKDKYRNPRNLASGAILRLNDPTIQDLHLMFVTWKCVAGIDSSSFSNRLSKLIGLGFLVVPYMKPIDNSPKQLQICIDIIQKQCAEIGYPIDGCVFGFDDLNYSKNLGATSHHPKDQLAFKFYDDVFSTKLLNVIWTMGKTGVLTPTSVFEPVEIDGTSINKASLHNISIMKKLHITSHCTVGVYKANMIIPQIDSCKDDGDGEIEYPSVCPICGGKTKIVNENGTEVLMCSNPDCSGKLLGKFNNFVSKKCANIDGLSESTLSTFINEGFISTFKDIYHLSDHIDEIGLLDGFGERSIQKLLEAIEKSRSIKLENYIASLGIDGIGLANAKVISSNFDEDPDKFYSALNDKFNFASLQGFGEAINSSIYNWYASDILSKGLVSEFNFISNSQKGNKLAGVKFCITGTFKYPRDFLVEKLVSDGATSVSSVSKNIDILFCGDKAGSKAQKAQECGVKIVYESELLKMLNLDVAVESDTKPVAEVKEKSKEESQNQYFQMSIWDD